MIEADKNYLKELQEKIKNSNLSESEIAYYIRILRVTSMPDLTGVKGNPVNMIVEKLTKSDYFKDFTIFSSPEIVKEFETFDLFYFADNHVARRPSDSYFLQKTDNKDTNLLLRPHTTIMWYHYLVKSNGIEKLGIDSTKYNGWAFGFGIERLAMALKKIPDIRIFWSQDKRILSQWGNFDIYKEISQFPPVYKDISMIVPKDKFIIDEKEKKEIKLTRETESSFFAITGIIRDIGDPLIEEVKIIDVFENDKKFGDNKKSITINITFRSIERTLTNEEINKIYFEIRERLTRDLIYELR